LPATKIPLCYAMAGTLHGTTGKPAPSGHDSLLKCRSLTAPTRKKGHSISRRVKGILRQLLREPTTGLSTPNFRE